VLLDWWRRGWRLLLLLLLLLLFCEDRFLVGDRLDSFKGRFRRCGDVVVVVVVVVVGIGTVAVDTVGIVDTDSSGITVVEVADNVVDDRSNGTRFRLDRTGTSQDDDDDDENDESTADGILPSFLVNKQVSCISVCS
jgi:hypothetical protein